MWVLGIETGFSEEQPVTATAKLSLYPSPKYLLKIAIRSKLGQQLPSQSNTIMLRHKHHGLSGLAQVWRTSSLTPWEEEGRLLQAGRMSAQPISRAPNHENPPWDFNVSYLSLSAHVDSSHGIVNLMRLNWA